MDGATVCVRAGGEEPARETARNMDYVIGPRGCQRLILLPNREGPWRTNRVSVQACSARQGLSDAALAFQFQAASEKLERPLRCMLNPASKSREITRSLP
jgi:hypothetical protein